MCLTCFLFLGFQLQHFKKQNRQSPFQQTNTRHPWFGNNRHPKNYPSPSKNNLLLWWFACMRIGPFSWMIPSNSVKRIKVNELPISWQSIPLVEDFHSKILSVPVHLSHLLKPFTPQHSPLIIPFPPVVTVLYETILLRTEKSAANARRAKVICHSLAFSQELNKTLYLKMPMETLAHCS